MAERQTLQGLEIQELLNNTHLTDPHLVDHTTNGNHSQSSIHDFIGLVFLESNRVFAKTEWVESKVPWLMLSVNSLLEGVAADTLKGSNEEEDLAHAARLDEVVVCVNCKHLREVRVREGEEFRHNETDGGKHANTTVLDFSGLEESDVDVVGNEERVKVIRSRKTLEVFRLEKEGNRLGHLAGLHCRGSHFDSAGRDGRAASGAGERKSVVNEAEHVE